MSLPDLVDAALRLAQAGPPPPQACATGPEAALMAIEALAVCSPQERQANRSRWELAWRQLIGSTDWLGPDMDAAVGSGDAGALQRTPLYLGTLVCCSRGVFESDGVKEFIALLQGWVPPGRSQALVAQTVELALAQSQQ